MWAGTIALLWALASEPAPAPQPFVALAGVEVPAAIKPQLAALAGAFHRATGKPLVITDGTRRPAKQAALMLRNLERGDNILRQYANKAAVRAVAAAYKEHRGQRRAVVMAALTAVIEAQVAAGEYVSKHLREGAVDVRCVDLDPRERLTLKRLARAHKIAVVDESGTKTPHFHLNFAQ